MFAPGVGGGAGTLTWSGGPLDAVAVGTAGNLTYTLTVDDPAVANSRLTNNVVITATSLAADADPNERTTYADSDDNTIELPLAQLAKDVSPFDGDPFDGSDSDVTEYAVGEPVDFEITVAIPVNNRLYDSAVFDSLPSTLEFEAYGTAVISGVECQRIDNDGFTLTNLTPADVVGLTPDGETLGWWLGDIQAAGANCWITLAYTVHVDSSAVAADTPTNTADVVWHNENDITIDPDEVTDIPGAVDVSWDESKGPESEVLDVIEPALTIDKDVELLPGPVSCEPAPDADVCNTVAGASHRFTVTVINTGDGPAHDVVIVDTLPTEGATDPAAIIGGGVFDGGPPLTITWNVTGPIAAGGGSVTFTYDVTIGPSIDLTAGQALTNTADVTQYWGLAEADRETGGLPINNDVPVYGGARGPVVADSVSLTVEFPDLVIEKAPAAGMDASDARIDEAFRWRLVVNNGGDATAYEIDVDDVLPTGWHYVAGSATIERPAGAPATPLVNPLGGPVGPLVWSDVVDSLDAGETFAIEFDTIPQATLETIGTTGSFAHVNDSGVAGDDESGTSANEDGAYGDDDGAPTGGHGNDDSTAYIRRSDLSLSKQILEAAPYYFGDVITYRVTVTNGGPDLATDIVVTDGLDTDLVHLSDVADNGSYDEGAGTWTLSSSLPNAGTATLDIAVRINGTDPIANHAEISAAGQWDPDSTPGSYDPGLPATDEDDSESVSFLPLLASLGNLIWFDIDADGLQDGGEPGIPGIDVSVSWTDPGGAATITQTTTTNASGEWSFNDVPADIALTVTVDEADLPAGFTNSFELQNNPVITDTQASNAEPGVMDGVVAGITLTASTPDYLDVDFGYTGTGSIGDTVWYDQDASGTAAIDAQDQPLAGIDVIVTWGEWDSVIGDDPGTLGLDESADDLVFNRTTDAGGNYLVEDLPSGLYRIAVDTADLPAGIDDATYDFDFVLSGSPLDLDSESTYTLAGGEDMLAIDFAYTGTGRLGDTVWFDADGDGMFDADEVGLAEVDVSLSFTGPVGGTIVVSTTTDASGTYSFENLPLGDC